MTAVSRPANAGRSEPGLDLTASSPLPSDVEVTPVTQHGWRVTDTRLPMHARGRLLAFVERRGDRFEVMQLGAGFEWHEFESFSTAVDFVLRSAARVARAHRRSKTIDLA